MITEAEWLDTFAKPTKICVHKNGNIMVTFRIRYKYGKLAWYVPYYHSTLLLYCLVAYYGFNIILILFYKYKHPKVECYRKSEKLI
jgi:hypothetical protein